MELTEDIITDLSKIPGLSVTGRNSSFVYKGKSTDLRQVGRELGVRYVLEGSVRKAGNRVRITAQLIDADTDKHLWAGRFDRVLEDVFAVQDEIADEIVTALDVKLVEGEQQHIWRKYLENNEARELYRLGVQFFARPSKEGILEARKRFQQVIDLEPDSPAGYNGMGWSHWYDVRFGWTGDSAGSLNRASQFVQEALGKDDTFPAANILLSAVHLLNREFEQAVAASERAEQLAPSHDYAVAFRAVTLIYTGNAAEAAVKAQKAIHLKPVTPPWFFSTLAIAHYNLGEYNGVISDAEQAISIDRNEQDAHVYKAAAHEALGQHEQAAAEGILIIRADPAFTLSAYAKSQPYKDQTVLEQLLELLRKAGLPE